MTGVGVLLIFLGLGVAAYSMFDSTYGLGQPEKDRKRDSRLIAISWALILLGAIIASYL